MILHHSTSSKFKSKINLGKALLLSLGLSVLVACSSSDPQLTALSSVSLMKVNQGVYQVPSKASVSISGTCNKSVKSISIYKAGNLIKLTDLSSSGYGTGNVNCSTTGTFNFSMSTLDTNWGLSGLSGQYSLVAAVSDTFTETKNFGVVITGDNSPGLITNSQTATSTDSLNKMSLRIPANSSTDGTYNFKLRFK